jgi:2-octaprenyl-6-methoxyphenol hydroxylase
MPTGPLAILPLTGNRSSIVWSTSDTDAAAMLAQDDAGFLDMLRPAFGSFLGDISLLGLRSGYPLGLTLAQRYVAQRVALVGDAAHGIHPIAGQGLNAGLRDVAALVQVLGAARGRGEDWAGPQVLARYEDWRQPETRTLAVATDVFNRLFSNDNTLLRMVRDLGMGAVNAMPGLRRGLIREAAGLGGDMPELMRG